MTARDDDLRQLREADPVPQERVRGAARSARAQAVLEDILRTEPDRRAPGRGPVGIAVAAVLALAVAASVLVARRDGEVPIQTARAVLSRAAEVAADVAPPAIGAGEYLYVRTEIVHRMTTAGSDGTWTALVPKTREVWIAPDGSGRILETASGTPRFPGRGDRIAWKRAGRPPVGGGRSDRSVGPGSLSSSEHNALPTGLPELERALLQEAGPTGLETRVALFVAATDILSDPLVRAPVRRALYRILAGLDGVELLGEMRDPLGRSGTGVAVTSDATGARERRVLIFDETTSAVLSEFVVVLERVDWMDGTPPVTTDVRVFRPAEVVPSIGAAPGPAPQPVQG